MSSVKLKQLNQSGAVEGDIPRWDNTQGLWVPSDLGVTVENSIQLNPGEALVPGSGSGASKVVRNDYAATKHQDGKSSYAVYSVYMPRAPAGDVTVTMKFIMDNSGTGTIVRLATKTKSRAIGEDSSTAFDDERATPTTINYTTIGEIFEGTMTIPAATFAADDIASFNIGRDGNDEIAGGASDDANKGIFVIGVKLTVP